VGKKNDLRRLADATERIATALEKLAGITAIEPVKSSEQVLVAPLRGSRGDKFHTVLPDALCSGDEQEMHPLCANSHTFRTPMDLNLAQPVEEVPADRLCGHLACVQLRERTA
jgi:hypothetical protein